MLTSTLKDKFTSLGRANPWLCEHLSGRLEEQQTVLEKAVDEVMVRRAQGQVACLRSLIELLEPRPTRRD